MASPVTAQMVGNAFVTQYYNVLHRMPSIVYRFYTDASRLTRAEAGPAGKLQTAATQDEIHRVVTSLDHENCRAEIVTVDALDSFGGSVFVLVTGAMHKNNSVRKFVQSFFLAPQDRGYYVLNDIFRYLDEETQTAASVDSGSNGLHGMYESSQMASTAVVPEASDFKKPSAIGEEALVADELQFSEHSRDDVDTEQQSIEEAVSYQTTEALPLENLRPVEQLSLVEDFQSPPLEEVPAEKKSYASILRLQRDSHTSSQTAVAFHQAPEQSLSSYQHISLSQLSSAHAHAPAEAKQKPLPVENEVDLKSVYVKNLPASIVDGQLEDEMRRFGSVRPNSITVRSNKDGGLYAFVDFEDSISAQAAIEASPVLIGGRKAHIEERKSTYFGGRGHGRGRGRDQGRGMPQNNGSRAWGTYSTGVSGRGSSVYGEGNAINRGRGVRSVRGSSTKVPSFNNQ